MAQQRGKLPPDFQARVVAEVCCVPTGRVASYAQIAAAVGLPGYARHVGAVLGHTDIGPLTPWHRIVRAGGALAAAGDPARPMLQRARLEAEGVRFRGDKIPRKFFLAPLAKDPA